MPTPWNAAYKQSQRRSRAARGILTPPPTSSHQLVKIGTQAYLSAKHTHGRGWFWVRVG